MSQPTNDNALRSRNSVYEWFYVLKVCCKINLINLKSRAFTRSLQSIDIRYLLDHAASRNETNPTSRVLRFRFLKHLRRRGKLWSVVFSIFAPVSLSAFVLFKQQHSRGIKMKLDICTQYVFRQEIWMVPICLKISVSKSLQDVPLFFVYTTTKSIASFL